MFFLAPDSPRRAAHETAQDHESSALVRSALLLATPQMPLLPALESLFASAKAHSPPGHILDKPEQDAFVLWLSGARSPVSTRDYGLVFASFFSLRVSRVHSFGEVDFVHCPVKWVQSSLPLSPLEHTGRVSFTLALLRKRRGGRLRPQPSRHDQPASYQRKRNTPSKHVLYEETDRQAIAAIVGVFRL